jgi:spermidine synthase
LKKKKTKNRFEPVTFSEIDGVRYLHLGTPWIQGAMRIKKPDLLELEYAQQMMAWLLFLEPQPSFNTLQLGLGTGSITKFSLGLHRTIKATVVELNPSVIVASQSMFGLNSMDQRLSILQADALDFVLDKKNHNQFDTLAVDLFNGEASGPSLSSKSFYQGCFDTLKAPGVLTVNLFSRHSSYKKNINNLCDAFNNRVLLFKEVHDNNVVAIAFKGPHLEVSWADLEYRAAEIQKRWKLPTEGWVESIKGNNLQAKKNLSI